MTTATTPLSACLAAHVTGVRFQDLPASTVEAARRALLDAVGVMHAASGLAPEVQPFIELAASGSPARPRASVLGTSVRTSASLAALANGSMAHALDYEDAFDPAPTHPDASLIPAVLALAQAGGPVSGRELLTSIAVGCDLVCRLGLCLREDPARLGWYPPPILGAMGAVAGAARVLGLDSRQLLDAWSLMMLQNSCPGEITSGTHGVLRAVREAFPAQAAVTVAELAASGIAGFSAPFEGEAGFFRLFAAGRYDESVLLEDLGSRWLVEQLSFKPWPSCRGTHAAIEASLWLREQHAIRVEGIAEVQVMGGEVQQMLASPVARKQAPSTSIDAKFSLPFTVATALCRGAVTLDSFNPAARADPEVLSLARRLRFSLQTAWGRDAARGAVAIHLKDGRVLERDVAHPRGSPANPMSGPELVAKFVDCLGRASRPIAPQAAHALAARILAIDTEEDAGALF